DAIVVSGTTGESPTLSGDEKAELLRAVIANAAGRARVIMGTGSNCTATTVEASQRAQAAGADGILVVAPYYNKPSQAGLLKPFEAVAGATQLPVFVYNIPGRTGVNITPDTIIQLAERFSTMHALKDSTGSVDQAGEIAASARSDFRLYSGDDYLTLPFLAT